MLDGGITLNHSDSLTYVRVVGGGGTCLPSC